MTHSQLILLSLNLIITLTNPVDCFQIPLLPNNLLNPSPSTTQSDPPQSSLFQLQQALHISTSRPERRLYLKRIFNDEDRLLIDIRSRQPQLVLPTTTQPSHDALLPNQSYYPSSHRLKTRRGKIWTHKSSLAQWKLAHRHQINIDQTLRELNLPTSSITRNVSLMNSSSLTWFERETVLPDVTDIETLASLAKMSNNAYTLPQDNRWYDPGGSWNVSDSFGWEEDGLRGHIFATPDNSTVVVSIKGTSAGLLGNGGATGTHDKLNDNLFFSCCCARVSWSWSPVCDCYAGPNRCRESCVENALIEKSVYFPAAVELYDHIVRMYPHSQIWFSGHSLGGALAGLLGVTFGVPAVGFESPGDLLPAQRLHLPLPPGGSFGKGQEMSQVYQVFHTADPIAMGTCNGALSSCWVAGYALETRCHLGNSIIFDTVEKLKWSQDIRTHTIQTVIDKVLTPDWMSHSSSSRKTKCPVETRSEGLFSINPFRWPWSRKNDDKSDCTNDDEGPIVPIAQPQDCQEGDCPLWEFKETWDHSFN